MGHIDEIQITTNQTKITSITEFFSNLFFTFISLTKLALEGRQITRSACLDLIGSGFTGKFVLNIFDMLIASSSDKFPWHRPSIYNCTELRKKDKYPTMS
jgi:hypothetical protein